MLFASGDDSNLMIELRLTDNARDFISFGPFFSSSRVVIRFLLTDLNVTFFECQDDCSRVRIIHKLSDVIDATFHIRPKLRVGFAKTLLHNDDCSLANIESIITSSVDKVSNHANFASGFIPGKFSDQ